MKKSQLRKLIRESIKEHTDNQNPWHGHNYHIGIASCGGGGSAGSYGVTAQDYANLNVGDVIYVTGIIPNAAGTTSNMALNQHYWITSLQGVTPPGQTNLPNSGIPTGVHTIDNDHVCHNCCNHPDMPNAYMSYTNNNGQVITVPDQYDPWGANGGPQYTACWANCPQPPVEKYRCYDCNTPCSQQLIDAGHCPYDTTQDCQNQCTETNKWSCGKPDKFGNPRCRKCKQFEIWDGTNCFNTEQECLDSGDCDMKKKKDDKIALQPFTTSPQSKIVGGGGNCKSDADCEEDAVCRDGFCEQGEKNISQINPEILRMQKIANINK